MIVDRAFEILRYVATGALSVALNILVVVILTELVGLNYLLSISICFVTVTFVSFCLNRGWTFRKGQGGAPQDLARYVLVTLLQLPVSLASCSVCVELLHLPYELAMALVSALFVPMSYLLHRRWSFGMRWLER
jgi:putative flippase GtrA